MTISAVGYGLALGGWRRLLGAALLLLGLVVLGIATIVAARVEPPAVVLGPGVVASVGLGWWGYRMLRHAGRGFTPRVFSTMPVEPAPSSRILRPEDVVGTWRFYVDVAASTVLIELKPDGRYTQAIVANRGERIDGPGGTWTLAGPYLDLTAYRSALRAVTEPARWFFGDWQSQLVLYAKDDPQSEAMLVGLRRR